MTSPADVTVAWTEAVTLTARLRSTRRMEGKRRPGSTTATWPKGTSPPRGCGCACFKVAERAALVARVAGHDADVVAAALDALGLLAVEGLAHLAAEVLERQAQGLGGGLDAGASSTSSTG